MIERWTPQTIALGVLLCLGAFAAPRADSPQRKIEDLAHALRTDESPDAYRQLAAQVDSLADPELRAQAALALALADQRQERHGEALRWFEIARGGSRLADYAAYYAARSAMDSNQSEFASKLLETTIWEDSPLRSRAQRLRAELLTSTGDVAVALQFLEALPALHHSPTLLAAYAGTLQELGRIPDAAAALQEIYFEFPLNPEANPAGLALKELKQQGGVSIPKPGAEPWRHRAEKLWVEEAYIGAQGAYTELARLTSGTEQAAARVRAAWSLYRQGKRASACRVAAGAKSVPEAREAEKRALLSRCDLRARRWDSADAHLEFLAKQAESSPDYSPALFAAGRTAWMRGERERATGYYRRYLEEFPEGPGAAIIEWRLAWAQYAEGEFGEAARHMEANLLRPRRSPFFSRALYWRGRLALREKDEALARHLFARLVETYPREFLAEYGRQELNRLDGAPAGEDSLPAWTHNIPERNATAPPVPLSTKASRALARGEALIRVGLWEHAHEELESALVIEPHPRLWLARSRTARAQGQFPRATEFARRAYPGYLHARLEEIPREAWELLFPLEYWNTIRREAGRRKVDPYLVAGLIRQESRFDREAVSSAGALGLMQLMPPTARYLARDRRLTRERILTPEVNIRLGVQHLAGLFRRFDGSPELAVAAYNGGGTRLAGWRRELPREVPEFIESIPTTQTRNFAYIVLRNRRFYQDLYAEE